MDPEPWILGKPCPRYRLHPIKIGSRFLDKQGLVAASCWPCLALSYKMRFLILSSLVLATVGVIALTTGSSGSHQNRISVERQHSDLKTSFRVLQRQDETLPSHLRRVVLATRDPEIRTLHIANAHHLKIGVETVWILTGSNAICLIENQGGIACTNDRTFLEKGVILALFTPLREQHARKKYNFTVRGIAPDWAKTAVLRIGRTTRAIRIHQNVYTYHAHQPIFLGALRHD